MVQERRILWDHPLQRVGTKKKTINNTIFWWYFFFFAACDSPSSTFFFEALPQSFLWSQFFRSHPTSSGNLFQGDISFLHSFSCRKAFVSLFSRLHCYIWYSWWPGKLWHFRVHWRLISELGWCYDIYCRIQVNKKGCEIIIQGVPHILDLYIYLSFHSCDFSVGRIFHCKDLAISKSWRFCL